MLLLFILAVSSTCRWEEAGITYQGTVSQTEYGRACQRWDAQSPQTHSYTTAAAYLALSVSDAAAYCRNPSANAGGPWCYGADNNNVNGTWGYCDIPGCACEYSW